MTYFVAAESFVDCDGDLVQAGRTFVTEQADCYQERPQAFKPMKRTRIVAASNEIVRLGGASTLGFDRATATKPRRPARPVEHSYHEVELLERGYVDYEVSVGSGAREEILGEIRRAHTAAGQEVEVAGWLFGWRRPRAEGKWTEIALATRSTERSGTRREVFLSDPHAALAAVRNAGYPRMELIGDWHSHNVRGSELPSLSDAQAWAGTMDSMGRSAYVSVLVSPSEESGWGFPKFSAWIVGRYGSPSKPIVGRARVA